MSILYLKFTQLTIYIGLEVLRTDLAHYHTSIACSIPGTTRVESIMYFLSNTSEFISAHILTSHDFSWLQNGHVNSVSRAPVIFFFGGAFLFDFLRPIACTLFSTHQLINDSSNEYC